MVRTEPEVHPASFRDPSGFLFEQDGRLYRQVNRVYAEHYQALQDSGLYTVLVEAGLLLPVQERAVEAPTPDDAYRVIEPEPLEFVSYPFEWCFSQLKAAALTTLAIQQRALSRGLTLKDASAYNIQFHRGKPVLVDTLSFEVIDPGEPWVAYRQFCQHFLGPLALMAYVDVRLARLLWANLDGLPLDLVSRLLPRRTWLVPSLLIHLHLHAAAQRRFAGRSTMQQRPGRSIRLQGLQGLVANLEAAIKRLTWRPLRSDWADYELTHGYSETASNRKEQLVASFLEQVRPQSVWDLGANVGRFSRIASASGIQTVAFDLDPAAVELNYLEVRRGQETNLLPLVLDLANPSPALGWAHRERMSLAERGPAGAMLALALIHHLAISNNLPLARIAAFMADLAPWALVEFVPKLDPQVQRLLASRKDIFSSYTQDGFERAFGDHFVLNRREELGDSGRSLYWMERRH